MDTNFKHLTAFLIELGVERIGHTTKSYLAHLIGVYRDMEAGGCAEEVCRAGMFHSIYGTQQFQGFTLPLPESLRAPKPHERERGRVALLVFLLFLHPLGFPAGIQNDPLPSHHHRHHPRTH